MDLSSRSPAVRLVAFKNIKGSDRLEPALFDRLTQGLGDPCWDIRSHCIRLFVSASSTSIPILIRALKSDNYHRACSAAHALSLMQKGAAPAVVALGQSLDGPFGNDPQFRRRVTQTLAHLGQAARPAMDRIIAHLHLNQSLRRLPGDRELFMALASIGPEAAETIPALIQLLSSSAGIEVFASRSATSGANSEVDDDNEYVDVSRLNRWAARHVLKSIGAAAINPVLNALKSTNYEGNWHFEHAAIELIGEGGETARSGLPFLTEIVAVSKNEPQRLLAAQSLGKLGTVAQETIPTLIAIVRSPRPQSIILPKGNPAESRRLMRQGLDAVKNAAANGVRVADNNLRIAAVHALCAINKSDPRIQNVLKDLGTDISPELRSAAAQHLER